MNLLPTLSLGKGATRRQLLKALGLGAVAVPLMPTLDGWAAPGALPPKRLLMLFSSSGVVPEMFNPTGTETAWNFPTGPTSSTQFLNEHKADMIFLKGLARGASGGGGHEQSMGGLWTGNSCVSSQAQAPSVDQIIASKLPKMTDFPSFAFGVLCFYAGEGDITSKIKNANPYMIHGPGGAKITSECDPYKTFDKVFAGVGTGGTDDATAAKIRAQRQSIIDALKDDFTDVSLKVGREDRQKIAQHLDGIREIERRLQSDGPKIMGAIPSKPGAGIALDKSGNYPMLIDIANRMVVAALASDRTRVATLQYSRGFSQIKHSWVGANAAHHTLSHETAQKDVLAKIQGWYCQRFADLLKQMKAVQEGGQNLLDSTLCVYSNELALGWTHGCSPAATWWATGQKGRMNGALKSTGRFLDFSDGSFDYNQMLQTMVKVMGVDGVDKVGNFGKPGVITPLLA
jgi:hypothetical protein